MRHTPGPWRIDKVRTMNGAPIITASNSWMGNTRELCKVLYHGGSEDPEVMGNAALLESAPEAMQELEALAEYVELALRELTDQDTGWYYQLKQHAQQARKIIAKAKGE